MTPLKTGHLLPAASRGFQCSHARNLQWGFWVPAPHRVPTSPTASAHPAAPWHPHAEVPVWQRAPVQEESKQKPGLHPHDTLGASDSQGPLLPAAHPPCMPLALAGARAAGASGTVPGAEATLVRLWSSSSSGSRLRSVQSRHWLGNRVPRMGSLLKAWSLVTAGRRDHQSHQLQAREAPRGPGRSPPTGQAGPRETCLWLPLAALTGSAQMGDLGAGPEDSTPLELPWTSPQPSIEPPLRTHMSSSEPRN